MNTSTSAILTSSNYFCTASSRIPNSGSFHCLRKHPGRKFANDSVSLLKIRSWRLSAVRRQGILPISAHFRPPIRRRNTLRKKIVSPREGQVSQASEFLVPGSNLVELSSAGDEIKVGSSSDLDNESRIVENASSRDRSFSKDSVLWDKLDSWVTRYKEDVECWGIGTGPIFIVYQNSEGMISRVVVNEEEIIRRNPNRAWSLEQKEDVGEFTNVNSRLSRAKIMAKDIETGKYSLPKNSSICRYVVEGRKISFTDGLRSITRRGEPYLKIFPSIGFTLLCGCCLFWVMTKLIGGNDKVELTKEEVEMLRRKKMSRTKREELEKGSVQVLETVQELPVGSLRRPQLDRNELIKSIMQAEALRENSNTTDLSRSLNASGPNDDKIREIREMVRQVHELEQENQYQNDRNNKDYDAASHLLASKDQKVAKISNAQVLPELLNKPSDEYRTSGVNLHAEQMDKNMECSLEVENRVPLNNNPEAEPQNAFSFREEAHIGSDKEHTCHDSNATTSSFDLLKNEEKSGRNEKKGSVMQERISQISSDSSTKKSMRIKPRIIKSVKEAREYLAKKRMTQLEKAQHEHRQQRSEMKEGVDECSSSYDDKSIYKINQSLLHSTDIIDSLNNMHKSKNVATALESFGDKASSAARTPHINGISDTTIEVGYKNNTLTTEIGGSEVHHKKKSPGILHEDALDTTDWQTVSHSSKMKNLNDNYGSSIHKISSDESFTNISDRVSSHIVKSSIDRQYSSEEFDNLTDARKPYQEAQKNSLQDGTDSHQFENKRDTDVIEGQGLGIDRKVVQSLELNKTQDPHVNSAGECIIGKQENNVLLSGSNIPRELEYPESPRTVLNDFHEKHDLNGNEHVSDRKEHLKEDGKLKYEENWVTKNFQEFNPVIEEIGTGFKENYMVAKEKAQDQLSLHSDVSQLGLNEEDEELEWMNDEHLREIVFQVRENELAGRDPFHMMDADDKRAFFEGLKSKAEKVNEKLSPLHEWIHSRIENLDYGADGISLDDPLEKIMPRWKGPTFENNPEFLSKLPKKGTIFGGKGDMESGTHKMEDLTKSGGTSLYSPVDGGKENSINESKESKVLIESSDGTNRPGKKRGKEHWQHTKKWSQGFLDVYNSETDPEVKSIMRNMGKDLDRWMTEKDIQDVTDLMTKIPKRKRRYIEKKMNKLKREVEMFGAQAVVSKYREYSDEKEEDYLWWLDLPFLLCIELYNTEEGVPKVGFYSLEMAADLELDPKQYHVIAFEDPGDSKNFCYIVQAHMDMLGSGKAFVVARPPKDAFRDAKANGFSFTVIRKGEIKLNVDQTLEEVEEEITEIGSKIYHDKIMHDRSVDIRTLMKGVIAAEKSTKRKSRPMLMKNRS
ncbi:uncharacterized protein [Typha angustifolia]|uniref:uncharacterized protein n=1 Tax=Typha angustifolia TaxID=59011 RepID=UPI003C2C50BD